MLPDWSRRGFLMATGATLIAGCSETSDPPIEDRNGSSTATSTATSEPTPIPEPSGSFSPKEWEPPSEPPSTAVEPAVLVENLEIPWDISVAANGDLFVTERVGRVNRFSSGEIAEVFAPEDAIDAGSVPPDQDEQQWWVDGGEGGTLGVAAHPDYPEVDLLFVYYTASVDGGRVNRVSRFDLSAPNPAATETVLIDDIPANNFHNGGRIAFGPRGALWVTTGDAGEPEVAADPSELPGSVLRITVTGDPARDNPEQGDPRVFTYGHRNPQGIVWLPDGTPVATEHGPAAKDEINRLVAGADYGWPRARTEEEYADADGVHPPLANSGATTWAPTGSLFYTGESVPSWQNRLLVGGLISQQVLVATLTPPDADPPPIERDRTRRFEADWLDDAYTVTTTPVLRDELGRIRNLAQGHDGALYAITSNRDGRSKGSFPREQDDVLVRLESS